MLPEGCEKKEFSLSVLCPWSGFGRFGVFICHGNTGQKIHVRESSLSFQPSMLCIIFLTLWSIVSADEIWTSCNGPDFTLPDQISGYSMRCLSQMLPRKWDDGDPEELISVSMTRLLPPDFDGKNIVFMLQGTSVVRSSLSSFFRSSFHCLW